MDALDVTYLLLAVEPIGGILAAIPLAILKLDYPVWLVMVSAPPLAYVQVLVVDGAWDLLQCWSWWRGMLERRRSPRIERLLAGRGAFLPTFLAAPLVGPWVVMAFMRYARVPQRRVALPILLSMVAVSAAVVAVCVFVPSWF